MLEEIRGKHYPKEFVSWMFSMYGREELMPDDNTIWLWSIAYTAGYQQAREDRW